MTCLLVTNGDSAADLFKTAEVDAVIVPWRDVLHEGPVPVTENETEFNQLRATYLADGEINTFEDVFSQLTERNKHLDTHNDYDRIELWFEHDLYDQLQLVQVLSLLHARKRHESVFLIQAPTYLGTQTADNIMRFKELALPVSTSMMKRAASVWGAFRESTPELLDDEASITTEGFLFLRQALVRTLQELPGTEGLSRTERQILYSINRGVTKPGPLFARVLNMEEAAFLGDWGFFSILSKLAYCKQPLITGLSESFIPSLMQEDERRKAFIQADLTLTPVGADVLAKKEDHASHNLIDRWLGGTHLTNSNLWRWNEETDNLVAPPAVH